MLVFSKTLRLELDEGIRSTFAKFEYDDVDYDDDDGDDNDDCNVFSSSQRTSKRVGTRESR